MTEPTDTEAAEKLSRRNQIKALARASREDGRDIARPAQEGFARTFEPGSDFHCRVCRGPHSAAKMGNPAQQARAIASAKSRHYKALRMLRDNAYEAAGRALDAARILDAELAEADAG